MLPIPFKNEKEWENNFVKKFKYCIDVFKGSLPEDDYDVWVIAFKDKNGNEIFRADADFNEIKSIKNASGEGHFYHIWRSFECEEMPHSWLLWPHSKSKDWCTIIEQEIPK
jgi:hypothetical protein